MDIFMSDIPPHATSKELKIALEPHVKSVGVLAYSVHIFSRSRNKAFTNGVLTLPTVEAGQKFLNLFGVGKSGQSSNHIVVLSRRIYCRASNRPLDKYLVQNLLKEQEGTLSRRSQRPQPLISKKVKKVFEIDLIECGIWSTEAQSVPIFESYYSLKLTNGTLRFGAREAQIDFSDTKPGFFGSIFLNSGNNKADKRVSILYSMIASSIITSDYQQAGDVIFTLGRAPKMYQKVTPNTTLGDVDYLGQLLKDFGDGNGKISWERISSLDQDHAHFAPFAFVYRLLVKEVSDLNLIRRLGGENGVSEVVSQQISLTTRRIEFEESLRELTAKMRRDFKFPIAFQLHALVANGALPPYVIVRLLPHVSRLVREVGTTATATIMEAFSKEIPQADPLGELHVLSDESLLATLNACAAVVSRGPSVASRAIETSRSDAGMTYVYHASITPAGCYLYGPKLEMLNRVLRKYPDDHEYFLRVIFCDEDGDQMAFEPRVSQRPIYEGQYRHYLSHDHQLVIAGRSFQFLGFSSSSLRSQSCWFMAPFVFKGERLDPAKIISKLGQFSGITCPGRCAARIGQAFSDTISSIDVPQHAEIEIADIIRDNRNFSDGVGTISKDMLERIWAMSKKKYKLNPTVLQIRFAGAKGVVSLDTCLKGNKLCLRDSMIKFRGSTDRNIEICSRAKLLPMVLNRPLIKVLEDLGVVHKTFIDLQQDAVEELRNSTKSAAFAANFLRRQRIASRSIRFPWMIEALHNIELNFRDDKFLERALELTLLTALRDLKHKARIPVPDAVTLMGIVDETGTLEEGEIYCPYQWDDGKRGLVTGHVLITRSPVHHPGDVQMAIAVTDQNIPNDSPLKALNNCVVFSQKGSRDLPSKLAGGDLDGDLYNIVYDSRFTLSRLYDPAEYPRVEPQNLGRPVRSEDIVDFFLEFMQNNILGLISIRHLIIADQKPEGVNHPDCLTLAQMASTAVDFPKTGVKVDKSKLPKCSHIRPDFLAPGPRMFVEKESALEDAIGIDYEDGEDDGIKYYESNKILGKLYRAIDETKFLKELQAEVKHGQQGVSVIDGVWNYLEQMIQNTCDWHNKDRLIEAKNIKDSYERHILGMMRSYSDTPWKSTISEIEVFIGRIVGRERQTQRQKDASIAMKDDFQRLALSITESIKGESREDTLAVGMGCLYLCRKDRETQGPQNGLQSFSWVVASVLLTEMDKIQKEIKSPERKWWRVLG